jgi:hypothetical protein
MANYDGLATIKVTRDNGDVEYFSAAATTTETQVELESRDLDLGDDSGMKYVGGVSVEVADAGDSNLMMTIKHRNRMNDSLTESEAFDMSTGDEVQFPENGIEDRYFRLAFTDNKIRRRWTMTAASFFGRLLRGRL